MRKIELKKINKGWFTKKKIIVIGVVAIAILAYLRWQEVKVYMLPPAATVVKAEKKTVPVYLSYVGNTASVRKVDIRARIEGFLIERNFKEGDDVNEGTLLYMIDPKPFEAALDQAKGQLAVDEAALAFADEQVARYKKLVEKDFISRENYDNMVTDANKAAAAVAADRAAVEQAALNLGYCRMYAPFDGRIGRTYVHVGNLVGAGQDTKLATMVQLNPIYVYFSPSDEDVFKILKQKQGGRLPVNLTFTDGTRYPHPGRVDFVDNEVDTATSTVTMRATVPNPDKLLLPGIYVNIRLHLKDMPDAVTIPEKAIVEDQGGLYVMIITSGGKAVKRYITEGDALDDMRVITEGLKEGDIVITSGLQAIKPGMPVTLEYEEKDLPAETLRQVISKAIFN